VTDGERTDALAAKLDALRELVDERDLRYEQKFKSIDERTVLALTSSDMRYEQRFKSMDEKTSLALAASEKAGTKAEMATEKRFDSVNEFRGQQKDMMASFASRTEVEARFKGLEDKSRWTMDKVIMLAVALVGWALLLWRGRP
jgi:hypothetical protein